MLACGDEVNAETVRYLNRLSDLLFILSRGVNLAAGARRAPVGARTLPLSTSAAAAIVSAPSTNVVLATA